MGSHHLIFGTLWNVLLAIIPVALGWSIARGIRESPTPLGRWLWAAAGILWLVFLPNTCYLLTEWRHFAARVVERRLFDYALAGKYGLMVLLVNVGFYCAQSGVALLTFALAVRPIDRLLQRTRVPVMALAAPFFFVTAVGVYLGLVLRFNSWDLLTRSGDIMAAVLDIFGRRLLLTSLVLFAGFLWLAYLLTDLWIDGFALRWERWRGDETGLTTRFARDAEAQRRPGTAERERSCS